MPLGTGGSLVQRSQSLVKAPEKPPTGTSDGQALEVGVCDEARLLVQQPVPL